MTVKAIFSLGYSRGTCETRGEYFDSKDLPLIFSRKQACPVHHSPSINSINCISLLSNCIRHMSSTLRGPVLSFREHRHIPGNNYLTRDYRLKFGEYRKINRFGNGEKDMWVNDTNLKCSFLPRD